MTKEEKDLLLKDLLGRVLYGVKVDYHNNIFTLGYNLYLNNSDVAFENYPMLHFLENIESVKPYLRPMSSMTEKEKEIYKRFCDEDIRQLTYVQEVHSGLKQKTSCHRSIDWLNEHHFDYRGLIEKVLALEAPEGMYKN